jgi:acetaldehyde dehydrogenase (acetylating)
LREIEYKTMDGNLVQQVKENEEKEKVEDIIGVPVCGGNLSSPVVDAVNYIGEIHYKIGTRLYIENAD